MRTVWMWAVGLSNVACCWKRRDVGRTLLKLTVKPNSFTLNYTLIVKLCHHLLWCEQGALEMQRVNKDLDQVPSWLKLTRSHVPDFVAKDPTVRSTKLADKKLMSLAHKNNQSEKNVIHRHFFPTIISFISKKTKNKSFLFSMKEREFICKFQ